jgi:hypothetical protein
MTIVIITGLIAFVAIVVLLFIGRRVVRLAFKLALVAVVILLLFGATIVGWWRGWFGGSAPQTERPAASQPRRPDSNRRPTPR